MMPLCRREAGKIFKSQWFAFEDSEGLAVNLTVGWTSRAL